MRHRRTVATGLTVAGVVLMGFLAIRIGSPVRPAQTEPVQATAPLEDQGQQAAAAAIPPGVGGRSRPPARGGTERRPRVIRHVVQPGDTLWDLAARFGTDITTLTAVNGLREGDLLQVGQELRILTTPGLLYDVKPGDTLEAIAGRYEVPVAAIEYANGLTAASPLLSGQELILPGARPPYVWPLRGRITSAYGPRWGRIHEGLDIAAPFGAPVVAARAGWVEVAGWDDVYGNYIVIDHGDGVKTLYAHHSVLLVEAGERVESGQPIAQVGSTGYSTGPHLHFEVRDAGVSQDPVTYLAPP